MIDGKFLNITPEDVESVVNALAHRNLSGKSEIVAGYEKALADWFGVRHAIAYCNGTVTLYAALLAADVKQNDEVIVLPTAPIMTVLPILAAGAKPIFVDVKAIDSFEYNLEDLLRKASPKTKAIIAVPMWGYPIDLAPLKEIAKLSGCVVIVDAAQAHGSSTGNKYTGTDADIGSFSTHERKLIATGEGGFLVTDSDDMHEKLMAIRQFGERSNEIGKFFGMNFKLGAIPAALGVSQLRRLEKKLDIRNQVAKKIKEGLSGLTWLQEIAINGNSKPNYYSLVFMANADIAGMNVSKHLEKNEILSETLRYNFQVLYEHPLLASFRSECPMAELQTARLFTVPCHEGLKEDQVQQIIDAIRSYSNQ
jgi:perosamine synthetase